MLCPLPLLRLFNLIRSRGSVAMNSPVLLRAWLRFFIFLLPPLHFATATVTQNGGGTTTPVAFRHLHDGLAANPCSPDPESSM
jgi:hypothetical protein